MSGNRTVSIIIVALLHVALGYALITGLAYNVAKKTMEDLKTFDVEEEPPPPEEEPPPPEQSEAPPPPQIAAPPPIMRIPMAAPQIQTTPNPPPFVPTPIARPAPPAPPAPPPPVKRIEPQSAVGSLQGLIRPSDYPQSAQENEEQGSVTVTLQIGSSGRVSGCSVSASSGSRTLDSATCRILTSRAKFTPARDSSGNPTTGSKSQRITWRLE